MLPKLDHVVVAVADLAQAMGDYRDLGFTVLYGGKHASGATHNALVCFKDGTYIELLARTGEPPRPGAMDFTRLLDRGKGLVGYALASDDLESHILTMRAAGIAVGPAVAGGRARADGVQLAWKTALVDDGFAPFFIQNITPRSLRVPEDPTATTHANHVSGIRGLEIIAALTPEKSARYEMLFGVPPQKAGLPTAQTFELGGVRIALIAPGSTTGGRITSGPNIDGETLSAVYVEVGVARSGGFDLRKTHGLELRSS